MIESPPSIRRPYAKWVALACGFASALLLTAIWAYCYYVSSTRYYMVQGKEGLVYQLDRRTGETWVIHGSRKTKVEDQKPEPPRTARVLPDAERKKIEGKLSLRTKSDYGMPFGQVSGDLYNGSDWELSQVTMTVTVNFKDGTSWTRKFVDDVHGLPFETFIVQVPTGDAREVDKWTCDINEARGFPPSGD